MKICSKCKIEKPQGSFSVDKSRKDGLGYRCKECVKKHDAQKYLENRDKALDRGRAWSENNPQYHKHYYIENREKCSLQSKQRYQENHDEMLSKIRQWRRENIDKARDSGKKWRESNPGYFQKLDVRIANALRSRLYKAIKNGRKSGSTIEDLGCSIEEFKKYIAEQFESWMSWNNWGLDTWHLDHKMPLSRFDLTKREEVLKAVHYTNFQPLPAQENLAKSDNIPIDL